jgi:ZIP family zinc transporter
MRSASPKVKGMLNSAAAGILLFLFVDVMGNAFEATSGNVLGALSGTVPAQSGLLYLVLLVGGVALGLLGLVWFEGRYISRQMPTDEPQGGFSEGRAQRIAMMIATGIGLHNFSEGLAIGQSYAGGAISLALLLVIGFGLHNATEGFGIAAPLSGFLPSWKLLALLGLIGGGPTFLGAILGSFWVSPATSVLFLALAAGAILYVVKELLYHGRIHGEGLSVMSCLVLGFFIGFATDLLIKFASGS